MFPLLGLFMSTSTILGRASSAIFCVAEVNSPGIYRLVCPSSRWWHWHSIATRQSWIHWKSSRPDRKKFVWLSQRRGFWPLHLRYLRWLCRRSWQKTATCTAPLLEAMETCTKGKGRNNDFYKHGSNLKFVVKLLMWLLMELSYQKASEAHVLLRIIANTFKVHILMRNRNRKQLNVQFWNTKAAKLISTWLIILFVSAAC